MVFKIVKSESKKINKKNKTCKNFCKKVFLPEREEGEIKFSKNNKLKYIPIKTLNKTDKPLAKFMTNFYLQSCNDTFCQKSCKNSKKKWLKSFTKKRKENLIQQGAISGCRDLIKEFPKYYKNKNV